tara:strand:+ start:2741 stop:2872 length:132 start_codon:yes stop_codon:yes gene_type:complete
VGGPLGGLAQRDTGIPKKPLAELLNAAYRRDTADLMRFLQAFM